MKKLFLLFNLLIGIQIAFTQTKIDSLKTVLAKTTDPLERFGLLNTIFEDIFIIGDGNIDSASCIEMITTARKSNNDSLLAISYNMVASYFFMNEGDNIQGLEYLFKALPLAEKINDKRRISSLYFDIAYVYTQLQNPGKAIKFNRKGAENLPLRSSPIYDFMLGQYQDNMANCFLLLNKPDSALHYAQALNETNLRFKSRNYEAVALRNLAAVHEQLRDTALADIYYNKALLLVDSMSRYHNKFDTKTRYSHFLLDQNRVSEAKVLATDVFEMGEQIHNNDMKLAAAGLLRRVYEILNRTDSAYYYSRLEAVITASIFSQDNFNKIQTLAFNEEVRQIEEADRLADEKHKRHQQIQYAIIAFSIVLFLIVFLMLSRSLIANTKMIEFLSVIALLLVFEFVNLLLHPFLEKITDHSPFLMLMAMVGIAAILVPLHHRLEKKATAKLIEKNKEIRLAAARKTVKEFES